MLQYLIVVINLRNSSDHADSLGLRPLSTRSLLLSVLLGSHPPRLPLASLVAFCALFDVRPGTVRTALSRMVAAGEVVQVARPDGVASYAVTGPLLDRQRHQDIGRATAGADWNGEWITAIVTADARPVAERRHFRSRMLGTKMGELRPDVWMRPANLEGPDAGDGLIVTVGGLDGTDDDELVGRLWDLPGIDARSAALLAALDHHDDDLARRFLTLAAALNHLRTEPQLPAELSPSTTSDELRRAYGAAEREFQGALAEFLAPAL